MTLLFLDSSALVKRYLTEMGSEWIGKMVDPAGGHTITVAEITRVEVAAAIAARHRAAKGISLVERDGLVRLLLHHFDTEYALVGMSADTIAHAVVLTQRHRLRGYDAIQLATALRAHRVALAAAPPGLTFVAADDDLVAAARSEGLLAENPNHHQF